MKNDQEDFKTAHQEVLTLNSSSCVNNTLDRGKENEICEPKKVEITGHMVTRGKSQKSSEIFQTPITKKVFEVNTPATCASSPAPVVNNSVNSKSLTGCVKNLSDTFRNTSNSPNFKNTTKIFEKTECKSKNEGEKESSIAKNASTEEFYFDFDFETLPAINKMEEEFDNLISMNSQYSG